VNDRLALELIEAIAQSPVALERLRELVADTSPPASASAPAFTPRTLALELGRTERSIRAAIARGELDAVKRGRGYVIGRDAVEAWTRAPAGASRSSPSSSRPRRRPGPGPATRGLQADW
jgi:excisionase family DNA binding protein